MTAITEAAAIATSQWQRESIAKPDHSYLNYATATEHLCRANHLRDRARDWRNTASGWGHCAEFVDTYEWAAKAADEEAEWHENEAANLAARRVA